MSTDHTDAETGLYIVNTVVFDEYVELMDDKASHFILLFLKDSGELIAPLHKAAAEHDLQTIYDCVHRLKSSSASLGAEHLSALSELIEHDMREALDENLPPETVEIDTEALKNLELAFEKLNTLLQQKLKTLALQP